MKETIKLTRLIALDFDGTVVDSNSVLIKFFADYYKKNGSELTSAALETLMPLSWQEMCIYLSRLFNLKIEEVDNTVENFTVNYYRNKAPLKPYVYEFLAELKKYGHTVCILSATDEDKIHMASERLGILDFFDSIITPNRVNGLSKNRPEIYYECMTQYGIKNPEEITLFDDSVEVIETAKRIGFRTVGVFDECRKETEKVLRAISDAYIHSFKELL